MDKEQLQHILTALRHDQLDMEAALERISALVYVDIEYAKVDMARKARVGYPEVIYAQGKTPEQVAGIVKVMLQGPHNIMATRASPAHFEAVQAVAPQACYHEIARTITIERHALTLTDSYIAIVTAGTADMYVAQEAAETARLLGNQVRLIMDVGVAGIHRLFDKLSDIRNARVIIVVAGMEGALASVVAGLVDKPVVAVPTSVGYGAHFGGLAPLLGMLNSCANGVCVVNIDNGFGAAYLASMINQLK